MKITVERLIHNEDATLSLIYIDGVFQCFGLEDEPREFKVPEETRIPAGMYNVGVRTDGGFHGRYERKFPTFHRGMLHVLDIPDFEWVLIHVGNTEKHTAGCLLTGYGANLEELTIQSSARAYEDLYKKVIGSAEKGNLVIQYIDNDKGPRILV